MSTMARCSNLETLDIEDIGWISVDLSFVAALLRLQTIYLGMGALFCQAMTDIADGDSHLPDIADLPDDDSPSKII